MKKRLIQFSSSDAESTEELPLVPQNETTTRAPKMKEVSSSEYYSSDEQDDARPPEPEDEESLEISGETEPLDPKVFELEESERHMHVPGSPVQYFNFCYTLVRSVKSSAKGKRYIYTMSKGDNPLWFAKAKARHPKGMIPVSNKGEVHMGRTAEYRLKCSRGCKSCCLMKADIPNPLCTYETLSDPESKMPHFKVTIDSSLEYDAAVLYSKRPKKNKKGLWCLDFHNRYTMPSVKNAIFVKDKDLESGEELMMIRKTAEDSLAIDIMSPVPPVIAFAVGLSTFLNNL